MYLLFKHKNILPKEYKSFSKEERLLLKVMIEKELEERIELVKETGQSAFLM